METIYIAFTAGGGLLLGGFLVLTYFGFGDPYGGSAFNKVQIVLKNGVALLMSALGFGLVGLVGNLSQWDDWLTFFTALLGAVAPVLVIHRFRRLEVESNLIKQTKRVVGKNAIVQVTVPREKSGKGRVVVEGLAGRADYQAVTSQAELAEGTRVQIVSMVDPQTVEVIPAADFQEIWQNLMAKPDRPSGA